MSHQFEHMYRALSVADIVDTLATIKLDMSSFGALHENNIIQFTALQKQSNSQHTHLLIRTITLHLHIYAYPEFAAVQLS